MFLIVFSNISIGGLVRCLSVIPYFNYMHNLQIRYAYELLTNPIWKRNYDIFGIDEHLVSDKALWLIYIYIYIYFCVL
jgi:hypothetical protein